MRVRVLFFGRLKELTGCQEDWAELGPGARVEDVFTGYAIRFPALREFRPTLAASVNEKFATWDCELRGGDEVAFLPPVSGGAPQSAAASSSEDWVELVRGPLRTPEVLAAVKAPQDGAVVVFDGIVRDNSNGRRTLFLDYEAYEPMALAQLRAIVAELRRQFPVDRVALIHRLGRLAIGDSSVLIAVSAPHRAAAFDAARLAIEAVKHSVPIWKKEHFADGAVWVEGQTPGPLPESLAVWAAQGDTATKPFDP
jgi:molybdopterin synthase catalytic subunit